MNNYLMGDEMEPWKGGMAQTITFVITQDCNLRCKYCYMTNKNNSNVMTIETGERAIDYFLTHTELFVADAVVIDFIGGEPLLEIELIDHLTDYFKLRAYELNHKWFSMYRISISTNGILYSTEKVQKYIKKNAAKLSIGISIDGTKEKNDLQRVYPDGRGTYDDIVKNIELWKKQFPGASTKVTIGHTDLPYVKESIIHLWELGLKEIPANVVFEDVWEEGDDLIFYNQLCELADYIIDNGMWIDYNTSLFSQGIGYPLTKEEMGRNSCGTGAMISVDAKGNFYPCVRFMDYSLNNYEGYITGNIYTGLDRDRVRPFHVLNVNNQSDEECISCDIASGCQWCTGYNYDQSKEGTLFERNKSICKLHKARVKANNYLWSRLSREKGVRLKQRRGGKRYLFILLANNSVSFCNYNGEEVETNIISEKDLYKAAEYCLDNFVTPVLVHSINADISKRAERIFRKTDYINIYPYNNIGLYCNRDIIYYDLNSISEVNKKGICCILKVQQYELNKLSEGVEKLLESYERINIHWVFDPKTMDLEKYYKQLVKISDMLLNYYNKGHIKLINLLTDDLFNREKTNCEFGNKNYVLAPDGKVYICPIMFYEKNGIYTKELNEFQHKSIKQFSLEANPICKDCNIKHCKWCFSYSKVSTGEYNVPSSIQCKIAQVEKQATNYLYQNLKKMD